MSKKEYKSNVFDSPYTFLASDLEKSIKKLDEKYGIYIFIMNTDLSISSEQVLDWNEVKGAPIKVSGANRNLKEISKTNNCFYIGSSYSESLMKRFKEHFSENSSASSLKLNNNKRKWIKKSLCVYCFPIKKSFSKAERQIILPAIEKELHNKLKAIAGSSRT